MDTYDATEIAYKRGYQQAVKDILEEIEKQKIDITTEFSTLYAIGSKAFMKIKKKYTEGGADD